jgi:hypothetical protein
MDIYDKEREREREREREIWRKRGRGREGGRQCIATCKLKELSRLAK